ncbi:MAG TPA: hypothetical protein DCZ94_11385 [Lentisphaeria bacterium]|nr:hypothetical protein [Lentisphaeria bacterium]
MKFKERWRLAGNLSDYLLSVGWSQALRLKTEERANMRYYKRKALFELITFSVEKRIKSV